MIAPCMVTTKASLTDALDSLFQAEREARRWHDEVVTHAESDRDGLVSLLREAVQAAADEDDDEANVRLVALARLLGELEGPDVADLLIDVLASEHPEARREAGEHLQGLAFDRFKEVALAVERALERLPGDSPALVELPFVLVDVPEGGVVKLLTMFLENDDADVVAAAIEGLAEVGDPAAIKPLSELERDDRVAALGDEDAAAQVTISELAADAIAMLSGDAS